MRKHVALWALALAALAAAAVLALLADAVFETEDDLETRAAAVAEAGPPPDSRAPSGLRFRAARAMLGVEAGLELLDAIGRFHRVLADDLPPERQLELHSEAEAELSRIARSGGDPADRSLAANLNGVLLVADAGLDRRSEARFLQLGLESFRQAVTLSPGNDDAKYNLELITALLAGGDARVGDDSGSQGATGAGASPGGTGY